MDVTHLLRIEIRNLMLQTHDIANVISISWRTFTKLIYVKGVSQGPTTELLVPSAGITVCWMSDTLYWTDSELHHIMLSKLDGRYHRQLLTNVGRPRGITCDALHG